MRIFCSGDGVEVLLFVQCFAEELPQLGVDGIRVIITQKAEAGINLLLQHFPVHLRKCRKDFDQCRQQVWRLGDRTWFAHHAPPKMSYCRPCSRQAEHHAFQPVLGACSVMILHVHIRSTLSFCGQTARIFPHAVQNRYQINTRHPLPDIYRKSCHHLTYASLLFLLLDLPYIPSCQLQQTLLSVQS